MVENKKKILIIAGPTAVGKSDIAVKVAMQLCGEIISADSAQLYQKMDIGTAKITKAEMCGVPHYMLNEVSPEKEFSVAEWRNRAEIYIEEITAKGKLPIFCGGTGLYMNALLNNLDFTGSAGDEDYRKQLTEIALDKGNHYVHEMLKTVDMDSYKRLFPNDLKRVIRALEVYKSTGKTITHIQEESRKLPSKYEYSYVAVGMDRNKLYARIDKRVDHMIENGLLQEVEGLLAMGYSRELNSMQAIGYKEIVQFLHHEITYEETLNILKQGSRRYAKRQFTWFRNDARVHWLNTDNFYDKNQLAECIIRYTATKINNI